MLSPVCQLVLFVTMIIISKRPFMVEIFRMSLVIRPGLIEDMETICQLVAELADYEREPASAIAKTEDFQKYGFGKQSFFETHLAEWNGITAGFSLHFYTFSTWTGRPSLFLEDLFVRPEFRG